MAAILNFQIFAKNAKHKFASISITVRDRAILSKYSTQRVPEQTTLCNSQKILLSSKMVAIFEFSPKMEKHKFASVSLTVRDKLILSKFTTSWGVQSVLVTFCVKR